MNHKILLWEKLEYQPYKPLDQQFITLYMNRQVVHQCLIEYMHILENIELDSCTRFGLILCLRV